MALEDAVQGLYAYQIVSGFDLYKPEYLNDLFRRHGDQGASFFLLLRSLGFEKPVASDTYYHFEENWIHESFKVKSDVGAPGAGNDIDITLHSDSVDANNRYYPRVNDAVLFTNEVTGYITAIDVTTPAEPVLTIRPHQATDDIGAVTAGDELAIFSNNHFEASGQPEGAVSGVEKYTNYAQIIKETVGVSGSELTRQTWIPVVDGQGIPSYFNKGLQIDLDFRMMQKIDGALLVGKKTDNTNAVDSDGYSLYTTEGLIPGIRRKGEVHSVAAGSFDVTDFDTIDKLMAKEYAGPNVLVLAGIDRHQEMENALKTYFEDTNIEFARKVQNQDLFGGNDSLQASVNFKILTKSERTFNFKRMGNFHNPKTFGISGYPYEDMALFLPMNKKRDPKSNEMINSIGYRYRALGQYNRRMEMWDVGGAGNGLKVTEFDKRNTYMRCHVGAHYRGLNQMVLLDTP